MTVLYFLGVFFFCSFLLPCVLLKWTTALCCQKALSSHFEFTIALVCIRIALFVLYRRRATLESHEKGSLVTIINKVSSLALLSYSLKSLHPNGSNFQAFNTCISSILLVFLPPTSLLVKQATERAEVGILAANRRRSR